MGCGGHPQNQIKFITIVKMFYNPIYNCCTDVLFIIKNNSAVVNRLSRRSSRSRLTVTKRFVGGGLAQLYNLSPETSPVLLSYRFLSRLMRLKNYPYFLLNRLCLSLAGLVRGILQYTST